MQYRVYNLHYKLGISPLPSLVSRLSSEYIMFGTSTMALWPEILRQSVVILIQFYQSRILWASVSTLKNVSYPFWELIPPAITSFHLLF